MADYGVEHNGQVFTPNQTIDVTLEECAARNEALQAAELARWAERPDRQLAYYHFPAEGGKPYRGSFHPDVKGAYVTLWPGARIGSIVRAHVYQHNFGPRMVSVDVQGSNGARYHGRASYDHGTCIWLRIRKAG